MQQMMELLLKKMTAYEEKADAQHKQMIAEQKAWREEMAAL